MIRTVPWNRLRVDSSTSIILSRHFSYVILAVVLTFHLIGNVVWILLNKTPLSWDEAYHITRSIQFAQFIQGVFGGRPDWGLVWHTLRNGYGPLPPFLYGTFMYFAGAGTPQTQIISTAVFLGTVFSVFLLVKAISHDASVSVTSAVIFSLYQLVYAQSRWPLLDLPITLFITLAFYFLARSDFDLAPKDILIAGVLGGLAMLTKAQAGIYFVIPIFFLAWYAIKEHTFLRTVPKIALFGAIVLFMFCLWAVPNLQYVYRYLESGIKIRLNHPDNLARLETWLFYLKMVINNITTLWGFILLVPAMLVYANNSVNRRRAHVLGMLGGYYILFTLISNKDLRYSWPLCQDHESVKIR